MANPGFAPGIAHGLAVRGHLAQPCGARRAAAADPTLSTTREAGVGGGCAERGGEASGQAGGRGEESWWEGNRIGTFSGAEGRESREPAKEISWWRRGRERAGPEISGHIRELMRPGEVPKSGLFPALSGCRRRDSNPRPSDYDSAPLLAAAFGCSAFCPLIGRFRAIERLSAFGGLRVLPCPPLAHLLDGRPRVWHRRRPRGLCSRRSASRSAGMARP